MFKRELYTFSKLSFWVSMLGFVGVPCTHFCMFFVWCGRNQKETSPKFWGGALASGFGRGNSRGKFLRWTNAPSGAFFESEDSFFWYAHVSSWTALILGSFLKWYITHILPNSSVVQLDETWQTISVNTTSSFGFSRHSWLPAHQERLEEEFQQKEVRLLDFSVEEATFLLSIDSVTLGITQFLLWFWCHPLFW